MKRTNTMGSAALTLTLSVFFLKIVGFLDKIFLAELLGDEGMGYYHAAYTVYTFFFLLCSTGIPKAIAVMTGEEEEEGRRRETVRICLSAFRKIGGISAVLLVCFSGLFARLVGNSGAALSLIAIAPAVYFVSLSGVLRGYLNGCGRFGKIAFCQSAEGVARLAFCAVIAGFLKARNFSFPYCSAGAVLGISVSAAVGYFALLKKTEFSKSNDKSKQNSASLPHKEILNRLLSVALPITFSSAVAGAAGLLDLAVFMRRLEKIGFSEMRANALFGNYSGITVPMFNLVASLISPLCLCSLSVFAGEKRTHRGKISPDTLSSFLRMAALCASPFVFGFLLFSGPVLSLFFPSDSAAVAAPLLAALSGAVFMMAELTVLNTALEASGRPLLSLLSMCVFSAVKLISSYVFIGIPGIAVFGAPIGTTLAYAAGLAVSSVGLRRLDIKIPWVSVSFFPLLASCASVVMARLFYDASVVIFSSAAATVLSLFFAAFCYGIFLFLAGREKEISAFFCTNTLKKTSEFSK